MRKNRHLLTKNISPDVAREKFRTNGSVITDIPSRSGNLCEKYISVNVASTYILLISDCCHRKRAKEFAKKNKTIFKYTEKKATEICDGKHQERKQNL